MRLSATEVHALLAEVYGTLADPVHIPDEEHAAIEAKVGRHAAAYGEPHPTDLSKLLAWARLGPRDMMLDIGSGRGQVLLQAALESDVSHLIGIEISSTRHRVAEEALAAVARDPRTADRALQSRLEFRCSDFRAAPLPEATFVWAGITAFPKPVRAELWAALRDLGHKARERGRPFRILATEPPENDQAHGLQTKATIMIRTSWANRVALALVQAH